MPLRTHFVSPVSILFFATLATTVSMVSASSRADDHAPMTPAEVEARCREYFAAFETLGGYDSAISDKADLYEERLEHFLSFFAEEAISEDVFWRTTFRGKPAIATMYKAAMEGGSYSGVLFEIRRLHVGGQSASIELLIQFDLQGVAIDPMDANYWIEFEGDKIVHERLFVNYPLDWMTSRLDSLRTAPALTDPMKELEFLTGSWTMRQSVKQDDGSWLKYLPQKYEARATHRGTLIQGEMNAFVSGEEVLPVRFLWSWDGGRSVFRMIAIDSEYGYLDVFQGGKDDEGNIVLSNAHNGTDYSQGDQWMWGRWRIVGAGQNAFLWEFHVSTDKGETWDTAMKFEFERP